MKIYLVDKSHQLYIVGCQGLVQLGGLVKVGPAKVEACNSVLFTEGTPEVQMRDSVYIFVYLFCQKCLKLSLENIFYFRF